MPAPSCATWSVIVLPSGRLTQPSLSLLPPASLRIASMWSPVMLTTYPESRRPSSGERPHGGRAPQGLLSPPMPALRSARAVSGAANEIVVIEDVHKSFGEAEVLKGVDMVCRRGETTCVVGGSG